MHTHYNPELESFMIQQNYQVKPLDKSIEWNYLFCSKNVMTNVSGVIQVRFALDC